MKCWNMCQEIEMGVTGLGDRPTELKVQRVIRKLRRLESSH